MGKTGDPEDLQVLLKWYRAVHDWTQADLCRLAGVDPGSISDWEAGLSRPTRRSLERVARPGNIPVERFDELLPVVRALRLALKGDEGFQGELLARLSQEINTAVLASLAPAFHEIPSLADPGRTSSPADLCGQLCDASEETAADDAERALRLAELALRVAELSSVPEVQKPAILGYCWAFIGNARRVGGNLPGAEEAFNVSDRLWSQGDARDLGPLTGDRLLDLKASLRTYQGRFSEALSLLEEAAGMTAPGLGSGKLFLKEARALELLGEHDKALDRLARAEALTDKREEPRSFFGIRFNTVGNLCHLSRYAEAEALLPKVRELAQSLGNRLDSVRVVWLEGRVAAGLGRREAAVAAFAQVQEEFTSLKIAYDAALVSLELAVLWLEEGRTAAVKELCEQMVWIFESQKVHQEALAALTLFREAAGRETATVALTRRVLGYLEKAQCAPGLRFEG